MVVNPDLIAIWQCCDTHFGNFWQVQFFSWPSYVSTKLLPNFQIFPSSTHSPPLSSLIQWSGLFFHWSAAQIKGVCWMLCSEQHTTPWRLPPSVILGVGIISSSMHLPFLIQGSCIMHIFHVLFSIHHIYDVLPFSLMCCITSPPSLITSVMTLSPSAILGQIYDISSSSICLILITSLIPDYLPYPLRHVILSPLMACWFLMDYLVYIASCIGVDVLICLTQLLVQASTSCIPSNISVWLNSLCSVCHPYSTGYNRLWAPALCHSVFLSDASDGRLIVPFSLLMHTVNISWTLSLSSIHH